MVWTVNGTSAHARQLLSLRVDLRGLRSKLSWIRRAFSSDTRGRPELLPLHRQPVCSNWWFQRQMLFLVGGWMLKQRQNTRCIAVADSVLMNSRTQKILGKVIQMNQLDATMIYWPIRSAQHVSGNILPIISDILQRYRSPSTYPPQQQDTICCKYLSLTLLMMGKILPETCWADLIDQ